MGFASSSTFHLNERDWTRRAFLQLTDAILTSGRNQYGLPRRPWMGRNSAWGGSTIMKIGSYLLWGSRCFIVACVVFSSLLTASLQAWPEPVWRWPCLTAEEGALRLLFY